MSGRAINHPEMRFVPRVLLYWLAFAFVVAGLLNATPSIPGWDPLWKTITASETFKIRRFNTDVFYPVAFFWMMLIVVLKHSIWRHWADKGVVQKALGLFLDLAMVAAALMTSVTYLIELEAVCLLDQITGDRARLIAEALQSEIELAKVMGLPIPDTVEDPSCLNTTGGLLPLIVFGCIMVFLLYNIRVWGLPLVLVAIAVAAYTFLTVMNWYVFGAEGQSKYLVTILSAEEPRSLAGGREFVRDALLNNASGLLGRFLNLLLLLVFPYLILGALFGKSAGGQSLIKVAFLLTRKLRGGPAHAAIVSSAMFGTISGGGVVNVLSTGVLTIPMMLKRGFSKTFAGGVEAAASSGGTIMPPVMGVAAFVMASLTGVPYREIIIAAAIPAVFFFFCIFLSVVFQARKQNIQSIGADVSDDMRLTGEDRFYLLQIALPLLLVLCILLIPKDSVGCDPISRLLGTEVRMEGGTCIIVSMPWLVELVQSAAGDASVAGWFAVMLLICLMFLDRQIRANPKKVIDGLSAAGGTVSTLFLMFLAVTVIDVCLNFTALAKFVSLDVLSFLRSLDITGGSIGFQIVALFLTMCLAILLGMGMPAVPAYINVALLMGPMLVGLGIATFTAHMFIFYFAVASAITPPVAMAAFAAASITKADPMATGFSALRSGIVLFVIPFIFAVYPEMLLIDKAVIDPAPGNLEYLDGYDGTVHWEWMALLLARVILALFLVSSALAGFDCKRLSWFEIALRLALAVLVMFKPLAVYGPSSVAALALLGYHLYSSRSALKSERSNAGAE